LHENLIADINNGIAQKGGSSLFLFAPHRGYSLKSKEEVSMPISLTPWLIPEERLNVIEELISYRLIKWDNSRKLKLKSGGTTDIYINLRDARNTPGANIYIAQVFSNAIFRLNPDRFIEVPDAVTPFSSVISTLVDIPYLTVRKEAKEGRVADAKISGECFPGEKVCIYDDVITNGQSKLGPYQECLARDLKILPLVVLVDRQQGWKKRFVELGINMDIWPGMTLHDVRRHLIENGYMERCDPDLEEKNPMIIGLDKLGWEEHLPLIDKVRTTGCILKVNDLLWNEGIKNLIPDLQVYGRVMADIKGHDISNTLANISSHFIPFPPWAVTVHGSGGKEMIEAVVKKFEGTPTKVLVVTLLTSIDPRTCEEIYVRQSIEQVRTLARIAKRAGAHGFVCSVEETEELRKIYPEKLIVNPAIRSAGKSVVGDDQSRKGTPEGAIALGADHIVMGRQITQAEDPSAEVMRVLKQELNVI
jgi:orotidine-5'-phosphate decarboxylase